MGTKNSQYADALVAKLDGFSVLNPVDLARVAALYIKVYNGNNGVVNNVSARYLDDYDGRSFYVKFRPQFDRLHDMFLRNGMDESDRRNVFKAVARSMDKIPTRKRDMERMFSLVVAESQNLLRTKKMRTARQELVRKFKEAVKRYLHLTWELGFNVPSQCADYLVSTHRLDKYVLSGDFPLILLPFMPDLEKSIRGSYEKYAMTDTWDMLRERYFNHQGDYANMALEIKSEFNRTIPNFSDYFDSIYIDTYRNMMLSKEGERNKDGRTRGRK